MQLPDIYIRNTREIMGEARFQRYLESFNESTPVSIRLNPLKCEGLKVRDGVPVPWCRNGYYLPRRPNFTMDPLLHAGCYYVQEAASMFLDEVLRQIVNCKPSAGHWLDLCAAPGGKSTLLRTALPEDGVLYSNEPIRNRANILNENIQKWGYRNCIVTNNYPEAYRKSKLRFDVILCDVPCSGEGMFRKDEATISEWNPQNVERCWRLQREIVADAWPCLNDGGVLIYSTCTFNTKENEENIRWMLSEFEAEALCIETQPEWNITGSLLEGFSAPVYRFIPGISRSEGLFMAVLRKGKTGSSRNKEGRHLHKSEQGLLNILPSHSRENPLVSRPLTYSQSIAYLRGEVLTLPPDTPRGIVKVSFMGHPLGTVKNIGNRANNLYPKEWRIKTTHIPTDYEAILEHS